jgi:hypothetical protein
MMTSSLIIAFVQGPFPPMPPGYIPHAVVELAQSFFVTIAVIALGVPIIRAFTRRFVDRPAATMQIPSDVSTRLDRIEQAVDAIAIEVERISEAQRFQTRLMTESRGALPAAGGGDASSGRARDSSR